MLIKQTLRWRNRYIQECLLENTEENALSKDDDDEKEEEDDGNDLQS
jgi:hypothetical protein